MSFPYRQVIAWCIIIFLCSLIIDPKNIFDSRFFNPAQFHFHDNDKIELECQNIGPSTLSVNENENEIIVSFTGPKSKDLTRLESPQLIRIKVTGPLFAQEFRESHALKVNYNLLNNYSIHYPIQQHGKTSIDIYCLNTLLSHFEKDIHSTYNYENYTIFHSNNTYYSACTFSNQIYFLLNGFLLTLPNLSIPYSTEIDSKVIFHPKTALYISKPDSSTISSIRNELANDINAIMIKTEQNKDYIDKYFSDIDSQRLEESKDRCYQKILVY